MAAASLGVRRGVCLAMAFLPVLTWGCRGLDGGRLTSRRVPEMNHDELVRYAKCEQELTSADPEVRQNAAVALLSMGHPRSLEAVLDRMENTSEPGVRVSMIEAASFCVDHRCFEAMLRAVKDSDHSVKAAAASALGRFSRPGEVAAVVALASDPVTTLRERELLYAALGAGLFLRATPVLLAGLRSEHETEREAAWKALRQISGRELPPDPEQWDGWWRANQGKSREDVLEERVRTLTIRLRVSTEQNEALTGEFDEFYAIVKSAEGKAPHVLFAALGSAHSRVRGYAAFRLAALEPEALKVIPFDDRGAYDTLRGALIDPNDEVREDVVELTVKLNGKFRNTLLLEAIGDRSSSVAIKAIDAANKDMGEEGVVRLGIALASADPRVREAAANGLGKVGLVSAVAPLVGVLDDAEENVRWFAVESLRKLQATAAVPRLCELLQQDASARVREITASTLGELGQPAAVPALRKALGDENERVIMRAISALQMLARDNLERIMVIADALAEHGHHAATEEVLRKALADFGQQPDLKTQLVAVRLLLGSVLKAREDFRGAAEVYAELDKLAGGDRKAREEIVGCWLAAGEARRVVDEVSVWVEDTPTRDLAEAIDLGCWAVQVLDDDEKKDLAEQLVDGLLKVARKSKNDELIDRIQDLKARYGPGGGE